MTCDAATISEYLDNELDVDDRATFELHLHHCEECAALMKQFEAIGAQLRNVRAPEALHAGIIHQMPDYREMLRRKVRFAELAAAAVIIAVLIWQPWKSLTNVRTAQSDVGVSTLPSRTDTNGTSPKFDTSLNPDTNHKGVSPPTVLGPSDGNRIYGGTVDDAALESKANDETSQHNSQSLVTKSWTNLELDLPKPSFGGTPLDYSNSEHLEEQSFKPRDPLLVPGDYELLSQGRPVTSSATPVYGDLAAITDGEKEYQQECVTELPAGTQWVQIDLGVESEIYAIACWHFHAADRVYFDVIVQVADDAEFTQNVRTLFNNDYDNSSALGTGANKEYVESYEGKLFSTLQDGVSPVARYVRLYSKGSTTDETNHYIEVEVWGAPTTDNPVTGQ